MSMTMADATRRVAEAAPVAPREDPIELLSTIAHEIRAPLSALAASAEMLRSADAAEQQHFAEIIERQALRLTGIVEGLLEAYRAPSGNFGRIGEIIDVSDLLDEICAEQRRLFPRRDFIVTSSLERSIVADRRALTMILGNLVSNAAKYSPAETPVRIYCDRVGGHTRFRIEDEGPGVPDFLRLRVFRAGERGVFGGDSGCGLGLFIASRLCDAIGAEIQIENNDNRRGACFAVTLMG